MGQGPGGGRGTGQGRGIGISRPGGGVTPDKSQPASSAQRRATAVVDAESCMGCGACVSACSQDAIEMNAGIAHIDESKCTGCRACIDVCPAEAISLK